MDPILASYSASHIVVRPVATLSLMFFAYGFYVLLFIITIPLLTHHRRRQNERTYLWSTLILFILATAFAVLQTQLVIREALVDFAAVKTRDTTPLEIYEAGDSTQQAVSSASFYITNISNIVADGMLIHRCYTIWQSQKRISIPLSIGVFIVSVIGFTSVIMIDVGGGNYRNSRISKAGMTLETVYFGMDATVNFIITLLTAFKIWSISREVRDLMGRTINKSHQMVFAIILESGILYPTVIIIHLALTRRSSITRINLPVNLFPLIPMVAGIAPTLIIVRARLAAERDRTKFSTLKLSFMNARCSDQENATPTPTPTIVRQYPSQSDSGLTGNSNPRISEQCEGGKEDA